MTYEPTNPELIATAVGMALINRSLIEAADHTDPTDVTQALVSVHEHAAIAGGSLMLLAERLGCDAEVRQLVAEGQAPHSPASAIHTAGGPGLNDTTVPVDASLSRRQFFVGATVAMALQGPSAAAQTVAPTAADLAGEWIAAHRNWVASAELPGAGDFDTPECLHWEGVKHGLEAQLREAPVHSAADAQALLQMVWLDSDAEHAEWPAVPRWALARLVQWCQ